MGFVESELNARDYLYNLALKEEVEKSLKILEDTSSLEEYKGDSLNESISATLIISMLLALPSAIQSLTKAFGKILRMLFKRGDEEFTVIQKMLDFTEKWHHSYIKLIKGILNITGIFKKTNVTDEAAKDKVAEIVFYVVILGFAIHGGVASVKSIYSMITHSHTHHIGITTIETVLTQIKSKEVITFVKEFA